MADFKWKSTAATSLLTSGLNSLADAARAVSSAFDNSTNLDEYGDLEFTVQYTTSAPSAGTKVAEVYLLPSIDGTNYAEGSTSITPQKALLVGVFESRNGSTSAVERLVVSGVSIPPDHMKFLLVNTSGKTLASSGNTLKIRPYKVQSA